MIDQIGIAFCGLVAISLTQDPDPRRRRYACLFGLAGQPFWFYAAWKAQQWGVAFVALLYTLAWSRGIWTMWLKR